LTLSPFAASLKAFDRTRLGVRFLSPFEDCSNLALPAGREGRCRQMTRPHELRTCERLATSTSLNEASSIGRAYAEVGATARSWAVRYAASGSPTDVTRCRDCLGGFNLSNLPFAKTSRPLEALSFWRALLDRVAALRDGGLLIDGTTAQGGTIE
jgi:hypothetical protein